MVDRVDRVDPDADESLRYKTGKASSCLRLSQRLLFNLIKLNGYGGLLPVSESDGCGAL